MAIDARTTRMEPVREQALVAGARTDSAAFGELYDYYLPRIYAYVARRVEDRAVAEDLTATTFERALGAVRGEDFRNASFGGFLYRVAANAVVDHVRRRGRTVPLGMRAGDLDEGEDRYGAEDVSDESAARAFAAAVDRDTLRRALLRVPDAHRRVIVLKYFDGLEIDELCAALGCSRRTFAVKLHRALRALRAAVGQEAIDAA
jgi:RNA polymerase sigma-70 factor (ECF subfamily)